MFVWCACAWVDCLSLIIYPNKYSQETQGREASGRVWRYHTYDPFAHSWAGTRRTCHKRPRSRSAGKSETSTQTLQTGHRPAMGQWSIQNSQGSRQAQQSQSKGPTPARFLNRSLRNRVFETAFETAFETEALTDPSGTPAGFLTAHPCVRLEPPSAIWCLHSL